MLKTVGPVTLLIVLLALYTNSSNSRYLSLLDIQSILSTSAILAIIAVGQTVLIIAGQFDLSAGYAASAFSVLAARLALGHAVGSELVLVIVLVGVGMGTGVLYGVLVAYLGVQPFILTLGGFSIYESVGSVLSQGRALPVSLFSPFANTTFLGVGTATVAALVVVIVVAATLRFTSIGRFVRATGSNRSAAFLSGVPTRRTIVGCFVVNGGLIAFASMILVAQLGAGDPNAGASYSLEAIAASVLGGAVLTGGQGSIVGTYLAVILLAVIESSLNFLGVSAFYVDMVYGGVLAAAVTLSAVGHRRQGSRV